MQKYLRPSFGCFPKGVAPGPPSDSIQIGYRCAPFCAPPRSKTIAMCISRGRAQTQIRLSTRYNSRYICRKFFESKPVSD
jgi:hypothetical protein